MSLLKKLKKSVTRRIFRVRNRQRSRGTMPRVSVFRSLNHIYAQIIDDMQHKTLVGFSSTLLDNKKTDTLNKVAIAKEVGLTLGKMAHDKNISRVFFDRGRYLYHGRVQALADGLREAGLIF